MQLPINLSLPMMQTRWASVLNPLLSNRLSSSILLEGIVLASGANSISHKLGRVPVGWFVVDVNAAITLYRSAAFNDLTLSLTASGVATINLVVF